MRKANCKWEDVPERDDDLANVGFKLLITCIMSVDDGDTYFCEVKW